MGEQHLQMLAQNTQLTEQIARLTNELHQAVCVEPHPTPQACPIGRRWSGQRAGRQHEAQRLSGCRGVAVVDPRSVETATSRG